MLTRATKRTPVRRTLVPLAVPVMVGCVFVVFAQAKTDEGGGTPYRSPYDVAFSPDGKMLAASDRTAGTVALIDPAGGKDIRQVALNAKPAGVVWAPGGGSLYVAEHATGTVAQVDAKAGKVARRLKVGPRPIAVALAPKSKLLLATNVGDDSVSVVDLATGKERTRIKVQREPRSVAISPDESLAVVGNLLPAGSATDPTMSAVVSVLDLKGLKRVCDVRLPAGGMLVRGVAISPCGCWAYAVHTVGRFNIPTTQLERGWINTNAFSIIDLRKKSLMATMLLDHPSQGSADPWGITLSADGGTMWVSLSGVHKVAKINLTGLHKLLAGDLSGQPRLAKPDPRNPGPQSIWLKIKKDPKERAQLVNELAALHAVDLIVNKTIPVRGARGIDLSGDGKCLAVGGYYSGNVVLVDPSTIKPTSTVSLGPAPKPDLVRRGEEVFHDGTLCFQHWLSCATCHPRGRADGLNWDLLNDGMGNPKNTKSMVLSHKTPPAMARGVRASMEVAAVAGFRHILFCQPEPDDVKAVQAYLRSLKPAVSPHRQPDGSLSASAKRGKAIFDDPKTKCATCHPAGLLTDLKLYDVGTRHELDRVDQFDTPTLVELWRTAPYLHDGSAATLDEVLTKYNKGDRHGATSHLTKEQKADLVAYLLSL